VTTLIIYRGETQVGQVTLTGKPMKLGRGKDNDIVLDDPGKGVSRVHAELRPEGDHYRLVDLQSQNGTWVSGERVGSVVLARGVVAAMGPFRVAIDATSPQTQAVPIIREESVPDSGTEISRPLPVLPHSPAPAPEPAAEGRATPIESAAPAADSASAAPRPGSTAVPAASADKAAGADSATTVRPAAKPAGTAAKSRTPLIAVGAVILILVCGIGAYTLVLRKPKPVWDAAAATALVDSGRCQEALDQQINRALAAQPDNAQALQLKARCTAASPVPTTTVPPAPVTETNAERLDKAEAALATNACQVALDTANEVLAADANDERAKDVLRKATDCLKPPPAPPPTPATGDPVVRVAPARGGLEPLQGETGTAYKTRVAAMRKRYDDAVALLQAQRYQQALRELDALAPLVPPGYVELTQRRAEARSGLSEESNRAYAAAQQAEQRSEWNNAIAQYQRAHDLDPARDVTADVSRVNEMKARLGRQLCRDADAAYALGHNSDAADKYARVLELLPSTDDCYVKAKERLAKINRRSGGPS
jgi:tetratricopeptide (TPR) repeat protein